MPEDIRYTDKDTMTLLLDAEDLPNIAQILIGAVDDPENNIIYANAIRELRRYFKLFPLLAINLHREISEQSQRPKLWLPVSHKNTTYGRNLLTKHACDLVKIRYRWWL